MAVKPPKEIDLYWRPGCGFCIALDRGLSSYEISINKHNIWESAEAAAFVRTHANGSETVPTVRIGSSVLVNPTASEVLLTIHAEAPHLLPEGFEPPEQSKVGRFVNRILGG